MILLLRVFAQTLWLTIGAGLNEVKYTASLVAEGGDTVVDFTSATGNFSFASLSGLANFVAGTAASGETLITAASGPLGNVNFLSNITGASASAEATFVYNTVTGVLTFDADGTGALATAITIVTLTSLPTMAATDIVLA